MTTGLAWVALPACAVVALCSSVVLVSRLECLAGRWGLPEAALGLLVALAADSPEITSAVAALRHGHATLGAGVALGSNVFNLAVLLGVSALVASRIRMHRRVVALEGLPAIWIAGITVAAVAGRWHPWVALVAVLAIVVPYVVVASAPLTSLRRSRLPTTVQRWLLEAVAEEEADLAPGVHPLQERRFAASVAAVALVVVVAASAVMERAAEVLGARLGLSDLVVGGLVLAAITSLPNAVGAVYLARRGRGAAVLSVAMNSNMLNVIAGFLLPAAVLGLRAPGSADLLVAASYLALTVLCVGLARNGRLGRGTGLVIVAAYGAFVGLAATW